MICGANGWQGYRTVANDARGYDLSATDANGVATAGANNQNRAYNYELNYTAGAFAANAGYMEGNASNTAAAESGSVHRRRSP